MGVLFGERQVGGEATVAWEEVWEVWEGAVGVLFGERQVGGEATVAWEEVWEVWEGAVSYTHLTLPTIYSV